MKNTFKTLFILVAALCILFAPGCQTVKSDITSSVSADKTMDLPMPDTDAEPDSSLSAGPEANPNTTANKESAEIPNTETIQENTCTLSVECKIILSNMDKLKSEKQGCVPTDGIVFAEKSVEFNPGETVFDVLLREMKNNKIHMEFTETPMYKSVYIKGINNLYEFDCGEFSGWTYRINGERKNIGCSQCILNSGDKVEWIYTCDLGRDIE